ncbi:sensor histidine kinase [Flavobacterium selenitireducens]|uniref:sensor histidine kinase n=1 Tax=Flavobacterium selenitireducens TaxID=2722704 RepID=UPI00168A787B|nr:histidine kinase [Flavobacterium selenitireducens]MBD3582989.1 histidine kinase [Flavobacterium selenitireducens]
MLVWLWSADAQRVWHDESVRSYQGLPSDIVLRTQTDSKGFLYVATSNGLSRYDGYRFVKNPKIKGGITELYAKEDAVYFHNSAFGLARTVDIYASPVSIRKNNYQDESPDNDHFDNLFIDSRGRIWCSDFSNIKYFDSQSRRFFHFPLDGGKRTEGRSIQFFEPEKGTVWALTSSGIFIWREQSGKLQRHPDPKLGRLSCRAVLPISKSRILVSGPDRAVREIDPQTNSLKTVCATEEAIVGIVKLPGRDPILYSRDKVYSLISRQPVVIYTAQKSQINHVLADQVSGILWLSTNKGLVKLTPVDAVSNFKLPTSDMANRVITSIARDHQKTLWLTDNRGVLWSHDTSGNWDSHNLGQASATAVFAYGNTTFCCSDKGVFRINRGRIEKLSLGIDAVPAKKILLTSKSELWLLNASGPVMRFRYPSLEPMPSLANAAEFWSENTWNDIFEDDKGGIWLGGWAPKAYGIDIFQPEKNCFTEVSTMAFNRNWDKFFGDYVNRISQNSDGNLLFSGYGGFCIVGRDGNVLQKIDVNSYPISDGHIEGIAPDGNGNIVFATGDGLHLYNQKRDEVLRLSQLNGLPSDDLIYGFLKSPDGKFVLGTENGYTVLDLKKMLEPANGRVLRLSGVIVDGKMREKISGAIELSKDESDVTIAFSDLSYSDRNKVFYRYRFADEKRWNDLGNSPEIILNHISPGTYELEIERRNAWGKWESDGLEIVLIAHPPFYRSPVFYVFCFLLVLLSITAIYSYLLRRQRREAAYRQKIREAEMTTLRTQMNPHFMFNTLNSINSYIIQNQTEAASDYLTTFSKLMRNILEYSKEELIPLENELQALKFYMELESMRLEQSFDYTIKVDKRLKNDPLVKIPPLVIQPFVENAIWHGLLHKAEAGSLLVAAEIVDEDFYRIRIEDDGIGREMAGKLKKQQTNHKSYGMDITKQRLLMLHPENSIEIIDLKDTSGNPKGTAVLLTIKM